MTDEQRDPEPQADGVFGNLPSSRPGSRSPRRDGGRRPEAKPAPAARPAAAAKPEAAESRPEADAPPPPPPPPAGRAPAAGGGRIGGVEDLAWAGVAVAAQAATAGVRAASRLLEVVRKPRDSG